MRSELGDVAFLWYEDPAVGESSDAGMTESSEGGSRRPSAQSVAMRTRSLVVGFRVLLLALSACALGGALVVAVSDRGAGSSHVKYVCPMHPEVTSAEPGVCPICRMELEAISIGAGTEAAGAIHASTYQSYDIARSRAYGPDTRAPAWVQEDGAVLAVLYADELAPSGAEQRGTFFSSSVPAAESTPDGGAGTEVRSIPEPPVPWDRSTLQVHFQVEPGAAPLRPGDVGWLKLATRQREAPVVPSAAILEGADGPYVLVASSNGRLLSRRPVRIGREFGGMAAVLSGLKPSERVLIRGAFFLDAERRLRREAAIEVVPK